MHPLKKVSLFLVTACVLVSMFGSMARAQSADFGLTELDAVLPELYDKLKNSSLPYVQKLATVKTTRNKMVRKIHALQDGHEDENDVYWKAIGIEGNLSKLSGYNCNEVSDALRFSEHNMTDNDASEMLNDTQMTLKLAEALCSY